jgi:carbon-monoxide dehydrogenase medium subunit
MLPTNTHLLYPEFDYHAPTTIYEVTELLAQYGDEARVMAGGTDLLVQMKMERRQPSHVISLTRIPALKGIKKLETGELEIGATTSIRQVHQSRISGLRFSALAEACNWFSTVQIMHMATLGGNLCNASPAADSAPPLLAFDARVTLKSKTSERIIPLEHFFVAPGKTAMQPDELLTQISIPAPSSNTGSAFIKIARVTADISQVCAAVRITRDGHTIQDARIALGSVAPTPVRATVAERDLIGQTFSVELAEQIGKQAAQEIQPISDVRATREYRQHIAAVIVRDALLRAWERSQ